MNGVLCILPARATELDYEHGRAYITPEQMVRRTIDFYDDRDAKKIWAIVSKRKASLSARRQVLAMVCGWPVGPWGDKKVDEIITWPICRRELQLLGQAVESWSTRVPKFRVVRVLIDKAMKEKEKPTLQTGCDRRQEDWDIEDHYVRFILRCIEALYDNTRYTELPSWVRHAARKERVYIFFHIAMLIQYEIKLAKWHKLPWYYKTALSVSAKSKALRQ